MPKIKSPSAHNIVSQTLILDTTQRGAVSSVTLFKSHPTYKYLPALPNQNNTLACSQKKFYYENFCYIHTNLVNRWRKRVAWPPRHRGSDTTTQALPPCREAIPGASCPIHRSVISSKFYRSVRPQILCPRRSVCRPFLNLK